MSLGRLVMGVSFGVGLTLGLIAQEKDEFRIQLDPSVRSESVHLYYCLVGGFGAYADFTDRPKVLAEELFLPIYQYGQRARSLRAIVYAKGCELATFAPYPLALGPNSVRFECRNLGTVW